MNNYPFKKVKRTTLFFLNCRGNRIKSIRDREESSRVEESGNEWKIDREREKKRRASW